MGANEDAAQRASSRGKHEAWSTRPKMLEEIYKQKQDFYMSSADALKYGCIDEIVEDRMTRG